ncbi:hypothetical protein PHYSODRAFT_261711 [Phytophthora sojae]|uniref:Necrosis inducing-like protein NPP1 type n=1 Tax=Phytophthora sojae (strain P6497) TaxID=1094619 RepID=G5A180_PHYSP|nr:hypothetical protein PHYSODRAFT_261711 [Phytophthora sojae]EGZ10681.1 hypothetical protein PHYSODRAFT_261711 [Phytophthora sojae]|eukprot:XP_009533426.1 hypothetical protein PHYSODRAFT_261711 [Phytophthora sojae]
MNLRSLLFAAIATATLYSVRGTKIDHDKVQPFAQPEPATVSEKAAVKFKPSLIFSYACHPYPGVRRAEDSKELGISIPTAKGPAWGLKCTDEQFRFGMWVSAVVWLDNPALKKPEIRKRTLRGFTRCGYTSCTPYFTDYFNDTSPILVYSDLERTHGSKLFMSTANDTREPQDLIMWEQLTEEARSALSETDFGEKTKVPFVDANFEANLNAARRSF